MPCSPEADGTPTGACVEPDSLSRWGPFRGCRSCLPEHACIGITCSDEIWALTGHPNQLRTSVVDNVWHAGVSCDELDRETMGACCFVNSEGTDSCIHHPAEICARGWFQVLTPVRPSFSAPFVYCRRKLFVGNAVNQLSIFPPLSTSYKGDNVACRCPVDTQFWIDLGFEACIPGPPDLETWAEACDLIGACCRGDQCTMMSEPDCLAVEGEWRIGRSCIPDNPCVPDDDLTCKPLGMPVALDAQGRAEFFGPLARMSALRDECDHPIANPYLKDDGLVGVAMCMEFNEGVPQEFGVGGIATPDCAAAYVDVKWDVGFECGE